MSNPSAWQSLCVFAGANRGKKPEFQQAAQDLGRLLVEKNWSLVYGGGSVGMMGIIADEVLTRGGRVVGVIPDFLATKELLHPGLTETIVTADMHTRKAAMAERADAFIALPGGLGTFEEFFEVLTWAQLGVHQKPIGLLNVAGFYDPVLQLIDHAIELGFVRDVHRNLLEADADPARLVEKLQHKKMPELPKWTDLEDV